METVADAAGLTRFPLARLFPGLRRVDCPCCPPPEPGIAFDSVRRLRVAGTNKRPNVTAADRERFAAIRTLVRQGWGADNPAFRQIFTSSIMPAGHQGADGCLQRAATPERIARKAPCAIWKRCADLRRRRALIPGEGPRRLSCMFATTPGVRVIWAANWRREYRVPRFVALPGKNHILLEQDPGLPRFFEELKDFLKNAN